MLKKLITSSLIFTLTAQTASASLTCGEAYLQAQKSLHDDAPKYQWINADGFSPLGFAGDTIMVGGLGTAVVGMGMGMVGALQMGMAGGYQYKPQEWTKGRNLSEQGLIVIGIGALVAMGGYLISGITTAERTAYQDRKFARERDQRLKKEIELITNLLPENDLEGKNFDALYELVNKYRSVSKEAVHEKLENYFSSECLSVKELTTYKNLARYLATTSIDHSERGY